ncbi:hypothetical protein NBC2815_03304 [Xanthomonas fragariae]|nr:hypothetical protein NBC2815_03304 [Xanthomonas fragariae]
MPTTTRNTCLDYYKDGVTSRHPQTALHHHYPLVADVQRLFSGICSTFKIGALLKFCCTVSFQPIPYPQTAPVFAPDEDWCRQVEHDLAGVATVNLQAIWVGMRTHTTADTVGKLALGTVAEQIALGIAGQRLGEAQIVGWNVAIGIRACYEL